MAIFLKLGSKKGDLRPAAMYLKRIILSQIIILNNAVSGISGPEITCLIAELPLHYS